jgi:hypothetical protein
VTIFKIHTYYTFFFFRFNISLPWGANFAVYGRRNVAPSITQYDFAEFVKGGRVDHRLRRSILGGHESGTTPSRGLKTYDFEMVPKHELSKRSTVAPMLVNVTLLQYLDTGRWFLSVYNDDLRPHEVVLLVEEAEGISTACPNDCSGHGSCYLGKCDCIDGYEGIDCSKSKSFYNIHCQYILHYWKSIQILVYLGDIIWVNTQYI